MSSFLGSIGKFLGGVLPIAAPFIGGPLGAAAGLLGGVLGQSHSQNQANQYAGQIGGAAGQNLALSQKYLDPMLQRYMGFLDYGQHLLDDPYGQNRASDARYLSLQGGIDHDTDAAVQQLQHDLDPSGRGFARSGEINQQIGNLRSNEVGQLAGVRGDLLARSQDQRMNLLSDLLHSTSYGIPMFANLGQGAMGELGGLQGMYQSQADAFGQNLGAWTQALAGSGIFGKPGGQRPASAGNNTLGTNQAGTPYHGTYLNSPALTYNPDFNSGYTGQRLPGYTLSGIG